jgi:DNA/RNA endonuclease YhcR with UshA esterase domain
MRKINRFIFSLIIASILFTSGSMPSPSYAQGRLSPEEAQDHIGESQTVCGMVASTNFAASSKGQPTFLNLNRSYPNHIFTVVIWGRDRPRFKNPPEEFFDKKRICVTGEITTYRGKPQIEVEDPSQIRMGD